MGQVWLASYPRSGNTYFRVVARLCFGIACPSVYSDEPAIDWSLVGELEPPSDAGPPLLKTHEWPPPNDDSPAIYIVRDGRDAVVSYAHYICQYVEPGRDFDEALHAAIVADDIFGGWSRHVIDWCAKATVVVRFEELIAQDLAVAAYALRKVGLERPPTRVPPEFSELTKMEDLPGFFRRGKVGGWREDMPEWMHELFWERHGQAMELMGYSREADAKTRVPTV